MVLSHKVLVLYDAKGRSIESMAQAVAEGVNASGLAESSLITIEEASREDLLSADGLILGSPNWSGITGSFKQWLDDQGDLWEERAPRGASRRGLHHGNRQTFRPGNDAQAVDSLDAGLRNGDSRTALVGEDAGIRLLLRRNCRWLSYRRRFGPSAGPGGEVG